jgi:hypothetical protein
LNITIKIASASLINVNIEPAIAQQEDYHLGPITECQLASLCVSEHP